MIRTLSLSVLGVAALVVALGLVLPRRWHASAAIVIPAPPERVAPLVATLKRWPDWAGWLRAVDPKAMHTYAGPDMGVGARWQWSGPTIGRGAMTITRSDVEAIELEQAIESNEVNAHSRFTFTRVDDGTRIEWTDDGTLPLLGGYFLGSMEEQLNARLAKGLAGLKAAVEALPPPAPPPVPSSLETLDAGTP